MRFIGIGLHPSALFAGTEATDVVKVSVKLGTWRDTDFGRILRARAWTFDAGVTDAATDAATDAGSCTPSYSGFANAFSALDGRRSDRRHIGEREPCRFIRSISGLNVTPLGVIGVTATTIASESHATCAVKTSSSRNLTRTSRAAFREPRTRVIGCCRTTATRAPSMLLSCECPPICERDGPCTSAPLSPS